MIPYVHPSHYFTVIFEKNISKVFYQSYLIYKPRVLLVFIIFFSNDKPCLPLQINAKFDLLQPNQMFY